MSVLTVNKFGIKSFARVVAFYALFIGILSVVIDLILMLFNLETIFMITGWGSWVVYVIIYLILSPVVGYIGGAILGFILNLALKQSHGLELEIK